MAAHVISLWSEPYSSPFEGLKDLPVVSAQKNPAEPAALMSLSARYRVLGEPMGKILPFVRPENGTEFWTAIATLESPKSSIQQVHGAVDVLLRLGHWPDAHLASSLLWEVYQAGDMLPQQVRKVFNRAFGT